MNKQMTVEHNSFLYIHYSKMFGPREVIISLALERG